MKRQVTAAAMPLIAIGMKIIALNDCSRRLPRRSVRIATSSPTRTVAAGTTRTHSALLIRTLMKFGSVNSET